MAKGLTKAECAQILTALCRKRLVEAGYPVAAFGISESEVSQALEQRQGLETPADSAPVVQEVPNDAPPDAVRAVWHYWVQITGQDPLTEIDQKSKTRIEERLAFGFTAAELMEACAKAVNDPALVKRTKVRAISKPLESDRRVCALIGKVYVRPVKVTWLTPFEDLWKRHYPDGEVPFGVLAKVLSPLVAKHGAAAVLEEFDRYLETTNIAYVSLPKFSAGYGTWGYGAKLSSRSAYARDAVSGL